MDNTTNVTTDVTAQSINTIPETLPETSEEKFVRLANMRVNNALQKINLIGNLVNYKHNQEQTDQIINALLHEIEAIQARLENMKTTKAQFSL